MLTAIFRRCSNLFGGHRSPAKSGVHVAHPRLGVPFYFIAKQSVKMISTVYPSPERSLIKMMSLRSLVGPGRAGCWWHRGRLLPKPPSTTTTDNDNLH